MAREREGRCWVLAWFLSWVRRGRKGEGGGGERGGGSGVGRGRGIAGGVLAQSSTHCWRMEERGEEEEEEETEEEETIASEVSSDFDLLPPLPRLPLPPLPFFPLLLGEGGALISHKKGGKRSPRKPPQNYQYLITQKWYFYL